MTPCELVAALRDRGAVLTVEGGALRCRAPAGAIPEGLRVEASARKGELVALLGAPPPGVRLFFGDEHGRPCVPEVACNWGWEGGPAWFSVADRPVPRCEPVLAAHSKVRCPDCARRALRLSWQVFADGTRHLRCDCMMCEGLVKYIRKPDPWFNMDLEFRAAGPPPGGGVDEGGG
jgi:hypothetical protein